MPRSSSFLKIRPSLILTFLKFLFFIRLVSVSNDLSSPVYLFVLLGFASSKMVRRSSREIASRHRWWRHSRPFANQSRRVEKFNWVRRRDSSPPVRRTCNGRTARTSNSGTGLGRQSNGLFKLKVNFCFLCSILVCIYWLIFQTSTSSRNCYCGYPTSQPNPSVDASLHKIKRSGEESKFMDKQGKPASSYYLNLTLLLNVTIHCCRLKKCWCMNIILTSKY